MTWLVIGAAGQLGKSLTLALTERDIKYASSNSSDLDITSKSMTLRYLSAISPRVIVNAAAWTDVDGAESHPKKARAVNATGALNVALAAKEVGARLVHISTDYVFSGNSTSPWRSTDPHSPISVYGSSKAEGEVAVLSAYKEFSYIFRTAWLYSPWGKNFPKTIIKKVLQDGELIKVVNDQMGQPTSASDLADQIIDSVFAEIPVGIYHATNSGYATRFEFAKEILKLCNFPTSRLTPINSTDFSQLALRPKYSVLNQDVWPAVGRGGIKVDVMRNWKMALAEAMPALIHEAGQSN